MVSTTTSHDHCRCIRSMAVVVLCLACAGNCGGFGFRDLPHSFRNKVASFTTTASSATVLWSSLRPKADVDVVDDQNETRITDISPSSRDTTPPPYEDDGDELTPPPPQLPVGALIQRILDTAEDAYLHLKRLPYEFAWTVERPRVEVPRRRETVVVLGTGWAAHALLKTIDTNQAKIVVVSPINHFVFTPMLASAAVGTVEYRSMTEAIRACNPLIDSYLEGRAVRVDVRQKILTVQLTRLLQPATTSSGSTTMLTTIDLSYDRLIVAVGCKSADSLVPGAAEYALFLKTCDDARRLRTAVGEALELACRPEEKDPMAANADDDDDEEEEEEDARQARRRQKLLTFAIIGGGPTGVELVGELADFVRDVTRPRSGVYSQLRGQVRLVLLHGGHELVPQFDPDLRQHAYRALTTAGVDVRLNVRVDQVGQGFVKYTSKGGGGNDNDPAERQQQTLDVGLAVFAAGTEAVPFVTTLLDQLPAAARGAQGKIQVDGFLRCPVPDGAEMGSILVMGDAASFCTTDPVNNKNNSFLPQTAQVAGQQGAYVARLLNRNYDLTTPVPRLRHPGADLYLKLRGLDRAAPFTFLNLGLLAYVGGGEALTQFQLGDVPIFSYAGSVSFMLWRSVYLVKQVATRNRILVLFDWMKTRVFGRDTTRL